MKIRIILMSNDNDEFKNKTISEIQNEYFNQYLKKEHKYYYGKKGINALEGDLLLFEMQNKIIASAVLNNVYCYSEEFNGNKGSFDLKNICIFKPIEKEELKELINGFTSFGRYSKRTFEESEIKDIEKFKKRMKVNE